MNMKIFNYVVIASVAVAVIASFFVMGSPQTERQRRFDEERVMHLQSIQWQIVNYWQRKNILPKNLAELKDDISGFQVPADPLTGEPYSYEVKDANSFVLCTNFALESRDDVTRAMPMAPVGINDTWEHGPGRVCFSRTIDPELYKSYPKEIMPVPQA